MGWCAELKNLRSEAVLKLVGVTEGFYAKGVSQNAQAVVENLEGAGYRELRKKLLLAQSEDQAILKNSLRR